MFTATRLKLTAWYLLIIMAISIAFSTFIYIGSLNEYDRILRLQKMHTEHPELRLKQQGTFWTVETSPRPPVPDPEVIAEAKDRLLIRLIGINGIIFALSSVAGYFLAGRTLKPIKKMIDDQNRFITDASHELSTPLTSLRTSIEVNLRNKELTVTRAREVLQSNLEEVESLQLLSDGLIKLTQYKQVQAKSSFSRLSLKSISEQASTKVQVVAQHKHITIKNEIPELFILGDEKSICELFIILLDNAIKYSGKESTITLKGVKKDRKIELRVTDEGIGIETEDISSIFDRFYRVDKSRTKQQIPGYGLGLSIAKRIVTFHGGIITVMSEKNKGTTFIVSFPIF